MDGHATTLPNQQHGIDPQLVPVEIGEVVEGKYRVQRVVGLGGMACVVAAHHLELDRPIAIKFLSAEQAIRGDAVRRFLAEARAAARLQNPHVVSVLDVGTTRTSKGQTLPFMVMELLEGADLDGVLEQRGRVPLGEAVEYVLQACEAVSEAHALSIVHRDIKPGNLFVTLRRDGTPIVKLLDFGISKLTSTPDGAKAHGLTADRELMGSPGYMSPEQVRSAKDVDVRTDIWSLGIVLYELLAGHAPFEAENIADLLVMILHAPAPPIGREVPDVPDEIGEIIQRCLQKNREHRFASVDELAAALGPFRSATPVLVPDLPRPVELPVNDAAGANDAGVSVNTIREAPKRRIVLTACLSFAAVGMVLAGVAIMKRTATARAAVSSEPPAATSEVSNPPIGGPPPTSIVTSGTTTASSAPAPHGSGETSFEILEVNNAKGPAKPRPTVRPGAGAPAKIVTPPPPATPASTGAGPRQRTEW